MKKINTNINIVLADSAGNPLSSIAVGGVTIFQISRAKLSIICCCSRYIFQVVLLELNLSLVVWGQLKTVKKTYLPKASDRLKGAQRILTGQRVIRSCGTGKPKWRQNCSIGFLRQSIEPPYIWLLKGLGDLLTLWPKFNKQ